MAAIDRIIITRNIPGAEPHLRFAVSDKKALHDALLDINSQGNKMQMFSHLLVKMGAFSGQNLPTNWKDIFRSGEPFSWEFVPPNPSD